MATKKTTGPSDKREIRSHAKNFSFDPWAQRTGKAPVNTAANTFSQPGVFLAEALVFGGPAAIERQEKEGQRDAVTSDTLPTRGLDAVDEAGERVFEKMGIKIGEPVSGDALFTFVTLPAGWKKRSTSHSMWNELVDDKGRVRATFFYKAAFYDRDAHIAPVRRFTATTEPVDEKDYSKAHYGIVKDSGKEIARFGPFEAAVPAPNAVGDQAIHRRASTVAQDAAVAWLKETYPDFADPLAYWD